MVSGTVLPNETPHSHPVREAGYITSPAHVPMVRWVPRKFNGKADKLAAVALHRCPIDTWHHTSALEWNSMTEQSALICTFDGAFDPQKGGAWAYTIAFRKKGNMSCKTLAEKASPIRSVDAYQSEVAALLNLSLDLYTILHSIAHV